MKKLHTIKVDHKFFDALTYGNKTAEFRKNDRDYEVGDILYQEEVMGEGDAMEKTGGWILQEVTHIVHGPAYGIPDEYCMMSVKNIKYETTEVF